MIHIGSYDYDGLIRSFIRQDKDQAKTAGDRMSYYGNRLYSYSSVLAVLKGNILLIDKDIANYSVTSKKQANLLRTINMNELYEVTDIENPSTSLHDYWEDIERLIEKHRRARTTKEWYVNTVRTAYTNALSYANCFNVDKRTKVYTRKNKVFQQMFKEGIIDGNYS